MAAIASAGAKGGDAVVVKKSALDERDYRHITLSNQLQVLLIHDATTDKAAASLDCAVGHFSDPDELPGLAHFLEHMLFLGTEKYPDENSYNVFLSANGGSSNAYTSMENTNYHFDVLHPHLEEALDRFAQFFSAPLFTESATSRELKAVDSENAKNLQNDMWRSFQLVKSLADPEHPFSKFGTGNLETLETTPVANGISTREALLKFHETYYSANLMRLCVLGRESLDVLEGWVRPRFEAIRNSGRSRPATEGSPVRQGVEVPRQIKFVPIKQLRDIDLVFNMPPVAQLYRQKPTRYLSHLIGHEGAGSILSLLKARGLADSLSAGVFSNTQGFASFNVSIECTEEGISRIDEIVKIVFQYIAAIREAGVQQWIFDETQLIEQNGFRFMSKRPPQSWVSSLAANMNKYEPEDTIAGSYLVQEFDAAAIEAVLEQLVPSNLLLCCAHQGYTDVVDKEERWYKTKYTVEEFAPETLAAWSDPEKEPELQLPTPNDFIASDFDLRCSTADGDAASEAESKGEDGPNAPPSVPVALDDFDGAHLWFKQDAQFRKPKLCAILSLMTPTAYSSPTAVVLTELYTELVEDALNEFSYDATIAGLHYSLRNTVKGCELVVMGYNHKLATLAKRVAEVMAVFADRVDEARFALVKDRVTLKYRNFTKDQPFRWALYNVNYMILAKRWHNSDKLAVVDGLTADHLRAFIRQLLSPARLEMLVHGNATEEEAKTLAGALASAIGPAPLRPAQQPSPRTVRLPDGRAFVHRAPVSDPDNENSAIKVYLQVGIRTVRDGALLRLLAHLVREPCFDQLRTKEQLGYMVFTGASDEFGVQGLWFIVQSSQKGPAYLESRVEDFLINFRQKLLDMDDEEFQTNVGACMRKRTEKDKSLWEQSQRFWTEVDSMRYRFNRKFDEADVYKSTTKQDIVDLFERFIAAGAPQRRKLSSHIVGKNHGTDDAAFLDALVEAGSEVIGDDQESMDRFKAGLSLYPVVSSLPEE